jgi:hypothetical protein
MEQARRGPGLRITSSPTTDRVRVDPLDTKTSRHLGECEYVYETDPAALRVLLKVKPGMGGAYWWVECNACDTVWQVPHYAERVG